MRRIQQRGRLFISVRALFACGDGKTRVPVRRAPPTAQVPPEAKLAALPPHSIL
jgi:hypothetical protein